MENKNVISRTYVPVTVKRFLAFGLVALLAGCGGGGGGSSVGSIGGSSGGSSTPAPSNPSAPSASGWQEGVFASRDDFVAQCRAPRVGVDDNGNAFADTTGRTVDENNWLRAWTNELYLWYDEVEDMDPGLFNTPDYFDLLKTTATTASGSVKDSFHFSQNTQEYNDSFIRGISFGYGMSLRAVSTAPPREFIVWDVVADSSAGRAGVRRSQRVVEVDGEDFVNGNNVDILNAGLFPEFDNEAHAFVLEAFDRSSRISVNLVTSAAVPAQPVKSVTVLPTATGNVGYMHFNTHNAVSEQALVEAFELLEAEGVSDLVLDLRYNGGGFLTIAAQVGYMIAGSANIDGQFFERLIFNDKHTQFDPVTGRRLEPAPFVNETVNISGNFSSGQLLPTLNLSRVFVLSGSRTCSASESIINSLRGIDVEVVLIGGKTCGKPYGFYPFDNCGTTYFSVHFAGENAKNFGEYSDGFKAANDSDPGGVTLPGCLVADDLTREFGDPSEAMLAAALQYRQDESCPPIAKSKSAKLAYVRKDGEAEVEVPSGFAFENIKIMNR